MGFLPLAVVYSVAMYSFGAKNLQVKEVNLYAMAARWLGSSGLTTHRWWPLSPETGC